MASKPIECFSHAGRSDLDKKFQDHINAGVPEMESARKVILEEHEKLHNELNDLRKKIKIPTEAYVPHDNSEALKKINDEYNQKAAEVQQPPETPIIEPPTADQTGEGAEPPKGNEAEVAGEGGEANTVGVSHESLGKIADKMGLKQPPRGTFLTPEEQAIRGRALLKGGADPEQVAKDFQKDGKVSADEISVARAHFENLTRATQEALDKFGKDSPEYKEAKQKMQNWADEVVKPMGTASGGAFSALQGETDLDTGSFVALSHAFKEQYGKEPNASQEKIIKELSQKVKGLTKDVEELKAKLTEAIEKGGKGTPKKGVKEAAKDLADRIREKGKLHRPGSFSAATPASLVWDGAVEVVAKTVEAGGTIIQAISRGLDHIKESAWFKSLTDDQKKKAIDEFKDFHVEQEEADIFTRIANKKGSNFTTDEVNAIWNHAKKEYLDKGEDFDSMISKTANDLGLSTSQVRDAITTPKGAKAISDAMYKKQNQRNMAIQHAKDWLKGSQTNPLVKFLKSIPRFFFAAKVFGHGTVGMVTHSGINVYDPVEWKRYWPVFFKQFQFAYGNSAKYEQAMQDLKNDPEFTFWKRNGLAVDPTQRYDDYQFITKIFEKMGRVGRVLTAGDRGFNALKVYRLMRAKALWKDASASEKADPNTPKEIAKLVNHSTGTTNLKVSETAQTAFFAPNLELARWNKLIVDPAKAGKAFTDWKNATPAQKAMAKIVVKRAGRIISTYLGALAVNQGLLSLSGSSQKINFTNPMDSDWLKFKAGGRTLDMTGGMISLLGFLTRMTRSGIVSSKDLRGKSRSDVTKDELFGYVRGKLSPFASTALDFKTHHDFQGNTLPMFNDKPLHSWNKQLGWKEYLEKQQTPIPVAEYFTDLDKQMQDEGVPKPTINNVLQSLLIAATVGGAGLHIGEEPNKRPTPFTDEDKKDPTFKYFLDKGMELPNTAPTSEEIKDEKTHTIKKISDYPEEVQKKYSDTHKEFLKESLKDIKDNKTVYVNPYGEVSLNPPADGEGEETPIDKLNVKQLAEILHIAQSQATKKTKDKLFYDKD